MDLDSNALDEVVAENDLQNAQLSDVHNFLERVGDIIIIALGDGTFVLGFIELHTGAIKYNPLFRPLFIHFMVILYIKGELLVRMMANPDKVGRGRQWWEERLAEVNAESEALGIEAALLESRRAVRLSTNLPIFALTLPSSFANFKPRSVQSATRAAS